MKHKKVCKVRYKTKSMNVIKEKKHWTMQIKHSKKQNKKEMQIVSKNCKKTKNLLRKI